MSSDLESIRTLALRESSRQANERKVRLDVFRKMAESHLSEWTRIIEKIVASGYTSGNFEFYDDCGKCVWRDKSSAPKIEILYVDVQTYASQLQEVLGQPFYVNVSFYNPGPDGPWYSDSLKVGWYD